MRKEEAYKILGLKSGAPRIEVEKRYSIYMRKLRSAKAEQSPEEGQDLDAEFDKITEAYNLLMGYTSGNDEFAEKIPKKPNPIFKKLGIDEEKFMNNLYYFRVHIIVGIILIITIAFSIRSCVTRIDPNLNVVFMGNLFCNDTEKIQTDLVNMIPEVEAVGVDNLYISAQQERQDPQMQMAMLQKAMVLVAAGDVDIFILDKANFDTYAVQGGFINLDDFAAQHNIDEDKQYKSKVKDVDENEHVYGIDVLNSKLLKDANVTGQQLIAAISVNGENYDNAVKCLELLLDE